MSLLVIGAGSWGTALAIHSARQGIEVRLWGHEPAHLAALVAARENARYLPGIAFPSSLQPFVSLQEALAGVLDVLIAVPSFAFEATLQSLALYWQPGRLIWATKGLTSEGRWLQAVVEARWPNAPLAILSGPSFAKEVALGRPTAVTLAVNNVAWAEDCQTMFSSETFRLYTTKDMRGVQLGGVAKNILAIAVGISDALEYGANARSALITRGLAEMMRLGKALGAEPETLMGLSGLGDLILTATDNQSRNRRFGLLLGQGISQEAACQQIGQVVEGIDNAAQLCRLAEEYQVDAPIMTQVNAVLLGQKSAKQAAEALLLRPKKSEQDDSSR